MLKKAMIMAAGVGSRLEPLSNIFPKPLVPIANVPVMDILISHLASYNILDIIANTFYKSEMIQNHYKMCDFGVNIQFIKEEVLSGTAGGVKKCQFFFNEDDDFIIMSGDGLTDLDISKAYEAHKNSNSILTIVANKVKDSEVSKYGIIVTDDEGYIKSFQEKPKLSEAQSNLANTGIYICNYKIFDFIPENTFYDFAKDVFPSVMNKSIKINTYIHNGYWSDIGSVSQYIQSNIDVINKKIKYFNPEVINMKNGKYIAGENCNINYKADIQGSCVIGSNCSVGANTTIKNSIIWSDVNISDNLTIEDSIITSNSVINESIYNKIAESDLNYNKEYEIKI